MMPGMDGVETTKLIREAGYTNPVIALTANAVVGQKEIFLENGFDDFISKPIDIRQLDAILNRQIRDKKPAEAVKAAELKENEKENEDTAGVIGEPIALFKNIKGLDADSAVEAMGGFFDVYMDTIKLTARLLPERIEKMDKYIETDMKAFTNEAHGLKSVLKNIGAAALGSDAASLERAALENNIIYCNEFYPSFRAGLSELSGNLNDALSSRETEDTKEAADVSELLSAAAEAKTAAESFDRDGALDILAPYINFTYGEETDELLKEIVFALESFDCEGALLKLNKLEEI
jgi:CheY-like chemotaxis protein